MGTMEGSCPVRRRHILFALVGGSILAAALLVILLRPKPEVLYEVTFLPDLGGAPVSPRGMNDHGQVVGTVRVAQNRWHIFLWDRDRGMQDLGPCADPRRFEYVQINNAGQIAGTMVDPNGDPRAFLQDPNGARCILRAPAGEQVHIRALNNRGQVVGFSGAERGPRRAFVWNKTTGLQSLAPSGTIESLATGLNDARQVVGFVSLQRSNQWHAFLWDPNTGLRDLGPAQFGPTQACQINNRGLVVGQFGAAEDRTCVSTWTAGEGARRLDSRGASVHVAGLNEAGLFVARAYWSGTKMLGHDSPGKSGSYLWDATNGFQTMEHHLGRKDVLEFIAMDMNNAGRIAGLLRLKGQPDLCAVILEPRE
jgi:probable HAF family extracellular repeat protein